MNSSMPFIVLSEGTIQGGDVIVQLSSSTTLSSSTSTTNLSTSLMSAPLTLKSTSDATAITMSPTKDPLLGEP